MKSQRLLHLGDHSSLDHSKAVKLNVLFRESGLIEMT